MNTRKLIADFRASPAIQCADTGDMVASRKDGTYFYVPSSATSFSDFVKIDISELADGFFVNPINPFTWDKIIPVKPKK